MLLEPITLKRRNRAFGVKKVTLFEALYRTFAESCASVRLFALEKTKRRQGRPLSPPVDLY